MHRVSNPKRPRPSHGPKTLFLCINGGDEALERAIEGARRRGHAGVTLSLARCPAEAMRSSITRVAIRWKRHSQILGHLHGSVAEIVDAASARGAQLLDEADPDARPWPSLRARSRGCVMRITGLTRVATEAAWERHPSPQCWTYLPG